MEELARKVCDLSATIHREFPGLVPFETISFGFAAAGLASSLRLGLIWTFSASGKLFAYQSGVLVLGYSYGYFEARDLVKIGICLTIAEFAVLMLLVPFYWPLIGIH